MHWHLGRAFNYNLNVLRLDPQEQTRLEAAGIHDDTLQRYLAWRRSVLIAAATPALLAALLFLADLRQRDLEDASRLGHYWLVVDVLGIVALPVAVIGGALTWQRKLSAQIVMIGFLVSLILPLLVIVVPADWFFSLADLETDDRALAQQQIRVFSAVQYSFHLLVFLPTFLMSVTFGIQRACLRLKTLLPVSTVSGWFLVSTAPLFPLTLLPFFAVFNQVGGVGGNWLMFLGMVLLVASSLVYPARARVFIHPLLPAELIRVAWVQRISKGFFWAGSLCLLIYALRVSLPVPEFGDDGLPKDWTKKTLIGLDEDTSIFRPWDTQLLRRLFLETLSRSLFTTVLMTDLLLRVTLSVWHHVHAVSAAPQGAAYDQVMGALNHATNE